MGRIEKLRGTGIALITPFKDDKSIDYNSLERLVDHVTKNGIDYLVILGTTAESATLNKEEKKSVISCIKQTNSDKLPMVLGIGGNSTESVMQEMKSSNLQEFNAILSVSPCYNKPTQEGIYHHFKAIAENTNQNIVLYNVPGRTASNMEPKTTLRLANDFENIVAIKEASPNYLQSTEIIKDKPEDFMVISGDDEYALPMTLAGGDGVISVIGQALPKDYAQMIQLALDRKVDEAYEIHYKLLDITRSIYVEGNPSGVKQLLALQGIASSNVRLPLMKCTDMHKQSIENLYKTTL